MPTTAADLTGGCLCGTVRYRLVAKPEGAGWCHCRSCQLNSGSPAMAFASVPIDAMTIDAGDDALRHYASSDAAERWFCGTCGTPLWVQDRDTPQERDFSLATLDDPASVIPGFHIYWSSRIAWDKPADELPRFPRSRSEGAG
jgi:hypothetical protein